MSKLPPITFIGAHPKRFGRGRARPIKAIVLHTSVGSLSSMDGMFSDASPSPDGNTSAHYGIAVDGSVIHQYVKDTDTAYHAGKTFAPRAWMVLRSPLANPNDYTIGIEHADNGKWNGPRNAGQIEASVNLILKLCVLHNIVPSSQTIIPHNHIRADKGCPGSLPVAEIIKRVRARWDA
jgi:N-acetylmuramoyl-L-alanine amidase